MQDFNFDIWLSHRLTMYFGNDALVTGEDGTHDFYFAFPHLRDELGTELLKIYTERLRFINGIEEKSKRVAQMVLKAFPYWSIDEVFDSMVVLVKSHMAMVEEEDRKAMEKVELLLQSASGVV